MSFRRILIANRGEIAIRLARGATEAGAEAVMLFAQDDALSPHVRAGAEAVALAASGPAAYLDIVAVVSAAVASGCDALHPGYGFLSENAAAARACAAVGIVWIGPSPETLEQLGDKAQARSLAETLGVPVLQGTAGGASLEAVERFRAAVAPQSLMLKAVAGGGGRGMRIVQPSDDLAAAYAAAAREATAAFGDGALYAETLMAGARHIEVQVAGDGRRALALGDRDCSLQRRRQKLVEIAPAPALDAAIRSALADAAELLAEAAGLRTLATIEFLVSADDGGWVFMEANPRLQVEHTVTEEVTGVDLVGLQIALAAGASLQSLGLTGRPLPRGAAVQARVNMERVQADGSVRPAAGRLDVYQPPGGPGVRVDGCGEAGFTPSGLYDSLLAKVIARADTLDGAARRADRALSEFRIAGVDANLGLLRALLARPETVSGRATTSLVDENAAILAAEAERLAPATALQQQPALTANEAAPDPPGAVSVRAPLQATVASIAVAEGDTVRAGDELAVLEAMKMEHVVVAPAAGRVLGLAIAPGAVAAAGQALIVLEPLEDETHIAAERAGVDPGYIRTDLAEVLERWRLLGDAARPEAVERRRKTGARTARENIDDLLDPGSFREFGAFAFAAQGDRRSREELLKISPADGLVCGLGTVNAADFGEERGRCAALAYDYTVFAGTQGHWNHAKTDRLLNVVEKEALPVVWYCEGGGGRPGDDAGGVRAALNVPTFADYARLAGLAPKIAVVNGYCFAGNASIAGMSEILIATEGSNLGMAGPAMIEGGGLGVFSPKDIGPVAEQAAIGVVDVVAKDEAEATALARMALGFTQGRLASIDAADQRGLRQAIPENRLRVYDVRRVIDTLFDTGSVLELRKAFAPGLICGFARLEGRPVGYIANDPRVLGGAVDCDGADKASRLFQLADAFGTPVVSLVDTPGFMVGPESERQAAVRKTSRLFINGANLSVPIFAVVLRKAYGLGAMAMTGGALDDPMFTVAWPTGEFGGMGLEGAVRLAYRRELEAEQGADAKRALYDKLVKRLYDVGKATEQAAALQVDAVIDPAETRSWLASGLKLAGPQRPRRRFVDAW